MPEVVLDASALLALLNGEDGAQMVARELSVSAISAVNYSEVVGKLAKAGMPEREIRDDLEGLHVEVVPFDSEQAFEAGFLRPATKALGLSLGDRACLSLARRLGLTALTADSTWDQLSLGIEIRLIR